MTTLQSAAEANLTGMDAPRSGDQSGERAAIGALALLQEPDPRSLFWILGGAMSPEDAAAYQQRVMAQFDLPGEVPETVTSSFDRLRTLYRQALLCYDLYTVAGDQARLVAELALRERFVEVYGGTVRFTDGQGKTQPVTTTTSDQVYYGIRGADGRPRHWTIQLRSGRKGFEFTGGMASLLKWARAEGLLADQGDRMRDGVRKWFRDQVAHPTYHLEGPDHAERAIADVAHIIRGLWGIPSGTTVRRYPVLLAWTDTCVTRSVTGSIAPLPERANLTCVLVLADPDDPDLFEYDSRFESTHRPCDLLWGPATQPMRRSGSPITIPSPTRSKLSTACSCSSTAATGSASRVIPPPQRRSAQLSGTAPGT
jgi:plasmid stabilization system protein ParE